ncbi:hypothetical protein H0H87_006196 [Tephrocybe sp. NHM501043]|nr:hypothetical protein H0H87_006196 [Tephrocybe sp. NHM501043]
MARAYQSLPTTYGALPAGMNANASTASKEDANTAENASECDLEEGEITDEPEPALNVDEGHKVKMEVGVDNMLVAKSGADNGLPIEKRETTPRVTLKPEFLGSAQQNANNREDTLSSTTLRSSMSPSDQDIPGLTYRSSTTPISILASNSETSVPSKQELELAKDVVLDLLGWGVQPEYLVDCGISSHAIYRIFTDLNLRLPSNLSYLGPS